MTNLTTSEALKEQLHIDPLMFLVSGMGKKTKHFGILCGVVSYLDKEPQYYSVENGGFTYGKTNCKVRAIADNDTRISVRLQELLQAFKDRRLPLQKVTKGDVSALPEGETIDGIVLLVSFLDMSHRKTPDGKRPPCALCGYVFDKDCIALADNAYKEFCSGEDTKRDLNKRLTDYVSNMLMLRLFPRYSYESEWKAENIPSTQFANYKDEWHHLVYNSTLKGFRLIHRDEQPIDIVFSGRVTSKYCAIVFLSMYRYDTVKDRPICIYQGGFRWKADKDQAPDIDTYFTVDHESWGYMTVLRKLRSKIYDLSVESYDDIYMRVPESKFAHQEFLCTYTTDLTADPTGATVEVSPELCLKYSDRPSELDPKYVYADSISISVADKKADDSHVAVRVKLTYRNVNRDTAEADLFDHHEDKTVLIPVNRWNSVDRGAILRTIIKMAEAKYRQLAAGGELTEYATNLFSLINEAPEGYDPQAPGQCDPFRI